MYSDFKEALVKVRVTQPGVLALEKGVCYGATAGVAVRAAAAQRQQQHRAPRQVLVVRRVHQLRHERHLLEDLHEVHAAAAPRQRRHAAAVIAEPAEPEVAVQCQALRGVGSAGGVARQQLLLQRF